ncbi:hypothetical protein [Nocardioides sp.]|uniref:hypothetical protein n=1 Tax=Nocardioides sp. TaxID=35761 RepID=UPI0031FE9E54|nr:hypothetical protein [Nocardioides sp.]
MSGSDQFPPPGAYPPPGWAPQPPPGSPGQAPPYAQQHLAPLPQPGGWAPQTGMLGAAHKPGAMPLRPLGLGDMYDAAFRIIRFNPKATVGSAVLVASVAMIIPVVVTAILTFAVNLSVDQSGTEMSNADLAGILGSLGSLGLGSVLQSIGLILVTGMMAHVTAAAAIGRRLSLGEAWQATRGKRRRLIGLAAVLALMLLLIVALYAATWIPVVVTLGVAGTLVYGLVSVPIFLSFMCWFWVRVYYLPVPALMLEQVGVFGAIGRGFRLTRKQFWRTFGIALLTMIIAQIAGSMLALPISIAGQVIIALAGAQYALLGLVVLQALSTVVSSAFVAPFTTAVASLQYLDQRMRKEAYDVELMTRAGIPAS